MDQAEDRQERPESDPGALREQLRRARAEQAAVAKLLRIVATTRSDFQAALDAIVKCGSELFEGLTLSIRLVKGEVSATVATSRPVLEPFPVALTDRSLASSRAIVSGDVVHVPDAQGEGTLGETMSARSGRLGDAAILSVPMIADAEVIGALTLSRTTPGAFTDHHIALLQTFADQAVIAIENARLSSELEARNAELAESLEEQTATSEILRIISKSPTDIRQSLDAIAESAARLCDTEDVYIRTIEGDKTRRLAHFGTTPLAPDFDVRPLQLNTIVGAVAREGKTIHIADTADPNVLEKYPDSNALAGRHGVRSVLNVPMLREGVVIGVITARRREKRAFTDKQIKLLETFADQAVIAIENARLFRELQERNGALIESLDRQTATSEILRIISTTLTDVQPVLDGVSESAARLCGADDVVVRLIEGSVHRPVAHFGTLVPAGALPLVPGLPASSAMLERRTIHIEDTRTRPGEYHGAFMQTIGVRTVLVAPLLREGEAIGAIVLRRLEVKPFTRTQIDLLETFADQAVIAIENARLFKELQARNAELTATLKQQAATSSILDAISKSPTDTQPTFDAIVQSGARLYPDHHVVLRLVKGEVSVIVASTEPTYDGSPYPTQLNDLGRATTRAIVRREVVEIDEVLDYMNVSEDSRARAMQRGTRALLYVPMLCEDRAIGVVGLTRRTPGRFSKQQVDVMQTFAAQAVIAVQNVRLFNELQARNAELTETLEQQTATAEILRAISQSPTDTQPVFDAIVAAGAKLFPGHDMYLRLVIGNQTEIVANTEHTHDGSTQPTPLGDMQRPSSRAVRYRQVIEIPNIFESDGVSETTRGRATRRGVRAALYVPMLRENDAIGVLCLSRRMPGPFTQRQIALLETFAAQAVIAVENVRLFNELQARNAELTELLEQQTATSEILRVISSSPTDLPPVFNAIIEKAARLCETDNTHIGLYDGLKFEWLAHIGNGRTGEHGRRLMARGRFIPTPGTNLWRALQERRPVHVHDLGTNEQVRSPVPVTLNEGVRTVLIVPMIKEGHVIGALGINRFEVRPFTQEQINLVSTFANQAVIAIENARLFNELQARNAELTETLEQQTATAEILHAISRSPTNVEPVFDAIVKSGARLFHGLNMYLRLVNEDQTEMVASTEPTYDGSKLPTPLYDERRTSARAILRREIVHIPDIFEEGWVSEATKARAIQRDTRAVLVVPMIREDKAIGTVTLSRPSAGPFSPKQIELLQTFAAQAVIAVENERSFREIQTKSQELEAANRHKSAFLANMSHELRTPLNAIIGIGELLEEDARDLGREDELEPLSRILRAARHLLTLINDILDLSKIEAGRLDLHLDTVPVAPLLDEIRSTMEPLAARNGNRLCVTCEPDVESVYADQLRLRQALLNLGSNANKFTEKGEVRVEARREHADARTWIVFAVTDTGIGMSPAQVERLFQDFVQTHDTSQRKYGGTGLGLAITKRLCRMMGGDVTAQSTPGKGSAFTIRLPATAADFHGEWSDAGAGAHSDAGDRPLVLVVDDDASVRQLLLTMLNREGFAVATAESGEEAIRLARELAPRAITLDVVMPEVDGWEVLRRLKQDPQLERIPVVLVSILDEHEHRVAIGATDYMVKPVDRHKLVERLREICLQRTESEP